MTLYEKLNLAWKYLLLIVIVWAINGHASGGRAHRSMGNKHGMNKHGMSMMGGHGGMEWTSDGEMIDVRIEKSIDDGDTTTIAFINGEEYEVEKMWEKDGVQVITTTDGQTIKLGHGGGMKKKMGMKKKKMKD